MSVCNQCLVQPMCKEACPDFKGYLTIIVGKVQEPDFVEVTATRELSNRFSSLS